MTIQNLLRKMTFLGMFILTFQITAQSQFVLDAQPELKISGTSSLHDWDMVSSLATAKAQMRVEASSLKKIESLKVEMPAESIKSGKSGMDKNAYKALKTHQFKTIHFELKEAVATGVNQWKMTGVFTIAGVAKTVTFQVNSKVAGNTVLLEGNYAFKLTDFNITPPTALLGTVKTGNDVTISFKTKFKS